MAECDSAEPWYSWRRRPDMSFIKKWLKHSPELEERAATFASDPAVCPNVTWRDNDVFVSSFPRSGTHFAWHVTRMIMQRSAETIHDLFLDSNTCFKLFKEDNKQNDLPVRVLSGHEVPSVLSPDVILNGNLKFICVRRNPKDVLTSLHAYIISHEPIGNMISLEDYVTDWCNNGVQFSATSWYHHVRAWEHFMQEHHKAPIIAVTYEDLVMYPEECIKKIAQFLDIELEERVVKEIAEATRFDKLCTAASSDVTKNWGVDGSPTYYRKGIIGDWKNVLSESQSERIDAATEKFMQGSEMTFKYLPE